MLVTAMRNGNTTEDISLTNATLSLGSSRPTRTPWPSGTYMWKEFKDIIETS